MLAEVLRHGQAAHPRRCYREGLVKRVLLFTMEGNADGEAALAFFQARGAAVDVRDLGRDPEASAEVFRLAGRLAVPTIVIEDRLFLGFGGHREEIAALVRE
jgi:glutaredoxin